MGSSAAARSSPAQCRKCAHHSWWDDDGHSPEAVGARLPLRLRPVPAFDEGFAPAPVGGGVVRVDERHPLRQHAGDDAQVARVEVEMRVPARMQVAQRAVERFGQVQRLQMLVRHDVAGLAGLDRERRPALQQDREPADLQVGAGADHQVGAAHPGEQAGPRADVMRVLARRGRGARLDVLAADLPGERRPFRFAGEDADRRGRGGGERRPRNQQARRGREGGRRGRNCHPPRHQNACAACAPRLMTYCRMNWSSWSPSVNASRLNCARTRPNSLFVQSPMTPTA